MQPAFVILHHTGRASDHFDLMLDVGDHLETWQCPTDPTELDVNQSMPCTPLPDHRRAYLDYEGPISRNRGKVHRVAGGTYERTILQNGRRLKMVFGDEQTATYDICPAESSGGAYLLRRIR